MANFECSLVLCTCVIALQIQVGDNSGKAGKEKIDGEAIIGDPIQDTAGKERQQKMASARVESRMARTIASTSTFPEGHSGADQLPKEMYEMKLQESRVNDAHHDKVCM